MALLSGEVETAMGLVSSGITSRRFRMALLSGEVETPLRAPRQSCVGRSGWLCYPGKLKLHPSARGGEPQVDRFRMALLSGEVETMVRSIGNGAYRFEVPDGFAIRGS